MKYTTRNFTKQCIEHGFARLAPHFYARCIGDGIYQKIYTGFRQYISVESPNYSPEQRKDNYIDICLCSMYGLWQEAIFIPGYCAGGYAPKELLGMSPYPFNGMDDDYTYMVEKGFSMLDSINTQEELIRLRTKTMHSSLGSRWDLISSFLLCGQADSACAEVDFRCAHAYNGFFRTHEMLLKDGKQDEYLDALNRTRAQLRNYTDMWFALKNKDQDYINRHLTENFERNTAWAQKYNIPFSKDYHQRTMTKIFG